MTNEKKILAKIVERYERAKKENGSKVTCAASRLSTPKERYERHQGFLAGLLTAEGICRDVIKTSGDTLWHKASEELPMYDVPVIVTYDGNTDDCCFNHRSNNPEVKTTQHDWCEIGYEGEPTHWMEIPEIKED